MKKNIILSAILVFIATVIAAGVFVIQTFNRPLEFDGGREVEQEPIENQEINLVVPEYARPAPEVSLLAVGDIMLSRAVEQLMIKKNDFQLPFEPLADFLSAADITFGNLETAILAGRVILTGEFSFRTDPKAAAGLTLAGFDVLSLANNHTPNFGQLGLQSTFSELNKAGIKYVGADKDVAEAAKPVILEKQGMKFGFLAYTYKKNMPLEYFASVSRAGTNPIDIEKMKIDVENLRLQVDWLLVSIHDGTEYQSTPNKGQIEFARAAIDAGADLVLGSHPHTVQTFEKYKNGYIFYSLGNFVFDQLWSEETQEGLMAKIIFGQKQIKQVEFLSVKINQQFQPDFASASTSEKIISRLKFPVEKQVKFRWDGRTFVEAPGWQVLSEPSGNSLYQAADLDGDGEAEEAIIVDRIGYLVKDGKAIWKTDDGWQVDNVLIGDFNNDAISEIGFSLWKEGSYGTSKPFWVEENDKNISNHLFLYQWDADGAIRESPIHIVWGSSALDQPIKEMALVDFDADGKNELAVIEVGAYGSTPRQGRPANLSVWRFSGFNFFNIFKSRAGNFSGLRVFGDYIYLEE